MRIDTQRWGKAFFTSVVVLFLTACIDIVEVRQPAQGLPGIPFNVTIDAASSAICQAEETCIPVVFVSLPAGWFIDSCSYTGEVVGNCVASATPVPTTLLPTDPNNAWKGFAGEPITPPPNSPLPSNTTATITLQITPAQAGVYTLDYVLGRPTQNLGPQLGESSMAHRITIGSPASAIPTLSTYGYALMALSLAGVALSQRRKFRQV